MSPAKHQNDPDSLRSKIRAWFTDNPGEHRPRDVCDGLDAPEHVTRKKWMARVGGELSRMALAGDLARRQDPVAEGSRRAVSWYSLTGEDQ